VSAFAATVVDFSILFLLVEAYGVWYVAATATGACAGAVVNFLLNRYWAFAAHEAAWMRQAWKYALVSGGSLVLNSAGVWYFTESWKLPYGVSKVVISLGIALGFNYPLHRLFVFR
jgi:putative flippase GtrA